MFAGEALCAIVYVAMQVYRAKCRPAGYDNRYQRISIEDHDDSDDDDERDKHKLAINVTTADEKNAPAEVCNSEGVLCRACRLLLTDHVVFHTAGPVVCAVLLPPHLLLRRYRNHAGRHWFARKWTKQSL
jgi:hypothetical protein